MDPLTKVSSALSHFQIDVVGDCLTKGTGGLSLPMSSGKTIISLTVGLNQIAELDRKHGTHSHNHANNQTSSNQTSSNQTSNNETSSNQTSHKNKHKMLVVASKSLIASWQFEIEKFFGDTLIYEVFHKDNLKSRMDSWKIKPECQLVLTTPETFSKYYKEYEVHRKFVSRININPLTVVNQYNKPINPFLNHEIGGGILYSIKWGCFIVDEAQEFTNITTDRCQGLGAISSHHRWALSGTLFNEPKAERILGYLTILDLNGYPRTLPDTVKMLKDYNFKGLNSTTVRRDENEMFVNKPKVIENIITHSLTAEEAQIYVVMKNTLNSIQAQIDTMKLVGDTENVKRFSSYLLAMITYLRQSLVCPIIPLTSIAIDMADFQKRSDLSQILTKELDAIGLTQWLNNIESVKSSRIKKVLETMGKHTKERIVLFSCFRTCLDVLKSYIVDRQIFNITSDMSVQVRGQVIDSFRLSSNGILLLTYELGAQGLNLQCASTAILLDFWWNSAKTQQAVARIVRLGQMAPIVNIYFYTSNTGIEQAIFKKHKSKLLMLDEIKVGPCTTKMHKITMRDILVLINSADDNALLLKDTLKSSTSSTTSSKK